MIIHLWGTDGTTAGVIDLQVDENDDMSIIQVDVVVRGFKNFDFWWHKIYDQVQGILFTQKEIAEPSDEEVERIAKALDKASHEEFAVKSYSEINMDWWKVLAKAALIAMKEPTM
jgi:hypothetical protein